MFDPTIRKINKCDQPFNVDCGDRVELREYRFCVCIHIDLITTRFSSSQSNQRAMRYAHGRTDSLPIQTQLSATCSTTVSRARLTKSRVLLDCTSMNTAEPVCGLTMPAARDAIQGLIVSSNLHQSLYIKFLTPL